MVLLLEHLTQPITERAPLLTSASFLAPLGLHRAGQGRPASLKYPIEGQGAEGWRRGLHKNGRFVEKGVVHVMCL